MNEESIFRVLLGEVDINCVALIQKSDNVFVYEISTKQTNPRICAFAAGSIYLVNSELSYHTHSPEFLVENGRNKPTEISINIDGSDWCTIGELQKSSIIACTFRINSQPELNDLGWWRPE